MHALGWGVRHQNAPTQRASRETSKSDKEQDPLKSKSPLELTF